MLNNLLIISKGIRKIPHGPLYTPEFDGWVFNQKKEYRAVAGWGHKPTADRARKLAQENNLPYIRLEDGFLRSVRLGKDGSPPLSLIADPIGIYYDARKSSQLELWLENGRWTASDLLDRARKARNALVDARLSKYNHAPEKQIWENEARERVLVVDQTFGDLSVKGALADELSFRTMLQAAFDENPKAEIVIKTHPDVVAGYQKGYLPKISAKSPAQFLTEHIHPWSVLDGISKVYTVSSLLGFEALLAGKQVRCFGMPFYAGWGLTRDELSCSRRTRRCSLDEIFSAAYLKYARYVDPITATRCEIEQTVTLLSDQRRHWLQTKEARSHTDPLTRNKHPLPSFISKIRKRN